MMQNVNDTFCRIVEGTGASLNEQELSGGAKINMIFHGGFAYEITKVGSNFRAFYQNHFTRS